ncbi:hypothetical protein ATCC90586_000441 [Pythium insidiosum]|nr:hypothetical protein ATCC90586_000441 [Pythium insidiosum]
MHVHDAAASAASPPSPLPALYALPPKSPLHNARRKPASSSTTAPSSSSAASGLSSFDRMLLLRNMNVGDGTAAVARPLPSMPPTTSAHTVHHASQHEMSAAQLHRERREQDARRRHETLLMSREDYFHTAEGHERQRRQEERTRMAAEEQWMRRVRQHERAQLRLEEEARQRAEILARFQAEREQQAKVAAERQAQRKLEMEAKMKALKEAADAQAQAEYAARVRQQELEAQLERDARNREMEIVRMRVEDELSITLREIPLSGLLEQFPPFSEVLNVAAGSPAMDAGLRTGDLVIDFGGVTAHHTQCLLAMAECVQQHIGQPIDVVVIRAADAQTDTSAWLSPSTQKALRSVVVLVPRKWRGKGLLGCQLSPYKWSSPSPIVASNELPADAASSFDGYEALVIFDVQTASLAASAGLEDGDVLAVCGDLLLEEIIRQSAHDYGASAIAAVAQYLTHQREIARRDVSLEVHRWNDSDATYHVVAINLPAALGEAVATPLGCALTTYTQYYQTSASISPSQDSATSQSVCDDCYYSPLATSVHAASFQGHTSCLRALWGTYQAEMLDWRDDDGRSALYYACFAGHVDAVSFLLHCYACSPSHVDALSNSASQCDIYGDCPLHAAVASSQVDVVRELLRPDAPCRVDANQANAITGLTAAHLAPSFDVLRVLHEECAVSLVVEDSDGRLPLHHACMRGDVDCVVWMLCTSEMNGYLTHSDVHGHTALHIAAWCGYDAVVDVLIGVAASSQDPTTTMATLHSARTLDGYDAADLAAAAGFDALAERLRRPIAVDVDDAGG